MGSFLVLGGLFALELVGPVIWKHAIDGPIQTGDRGAFWWLVLAYVGVVLGERLRALPRGLPARAHGAGRDPRSAQRALPAHAGARPLLLRPPPHRLARDARHERRREPERDVHLGDGDAVLRPVQGRGGPCDPVLDPLEARAGRAGPHAAPDRHLARFPRRRARCAPARARAAWRASTATCRKCCRASAWCRSSGASAACPRASAACSTSTSSPTCARSSCSRCSSR